MFCTVCIGAHMTGTTFVDGNPSFKRDALRKHEKSKTHQKAEAILARRGPSQSHLQPNPCLH